MRGIQCLEQPTLEQLITWHVFIACAPLRVPEDTCQADGDH